MKFPSLPLVLALGLVPAAAAAGPAAHFIRKANTWMQSADAGKRQAAYRSWLQMGPDAMPEYRKSLDAAQAFHRTALDQLLGGSRGRENPYDAHARLAEELADERERVMPLIRTDWKKDPKKIATLREEVEGLVRLHERTAKAAGADVGEFDAAFAAHLEALVEIRREFERFEPEARSADLDDEALRESVVAGHLEASAHAGQRDAFRRTRAHLDDHERAAAHNTSRGSWCSGAMEEFAAILNGERAALGLGALRLEEKLSAACEGHSQDMARLGFFAHRSPVEDKTSPWDRAKLAGFRGRGAGENIFKGSSRPGAAYRGWFASDGHRFIMMADGPNTLGVGIAGDHWTMMTGRFDFPDPPD
jgi:uncharacterized protein YkwD